MYSCSKGKRTFAFAGSLLSLSSAIALPLEAAMMVVKELLDD
jgi:hypothetical protein